MTHQWLSRSQQEYGPEGLILLSHVSTARLWECAGCLEQLPVSIQARHWKKSYWLPLACRQQFHGNSGKTEKDCFMILDFWRSGLNVSLVFTIFLN